MSDHPSDLQWDRLLAGEVTDERLRDHASSCAACSARLAEITAQRDAFAQRPMPIMFAAARKTSRRRWLLAAPAVVAAAIVLLVLVRPGPRPDEDEREKGSGLFLFAGQPGRMEPIAAGATVHPGTYLQAAYTADREGYGAVLSRDGAGTASIYVPSSGVAMVALPAGSKLTFPQSTVLDEVVGKERIVIVWCAQPQPLEPLLAQLRTGAVAAPPTCRLQELELDKRALP